MMGRKPAYILLDAIVGLSLMTVLAGGLFGAVEQRQRAARMLADRRAALRAAEATLMALQSGAPAPDVAKLDVKVDVHTIDSAAPDVGLHWIEVTAEVHGQRQDIVGVFRKQNDSLQPGKP